MTLNKKAITSALAGVVVVGGLLSVWWDIEPDVIDVNALSIEQAEVLGVKPVPGFATMTAVISVTDTLLTKPGGYLTNDKIYPSVLMDNMPAFEFGALQQIRDLALVLRSDFSRSQSQSVEDADLVKAQPALNFENNSWIFPSTESEYKKALKHFELYRTRLANPSSNAQFYARADNLTEWLKEVEKRLGSISQRLSASVGQDRLNTDLAGDSAAVQSTKAASHQEVKTSWFKLDDVFYEARGTSWALIHFLKAVEIDFAPVLEKKNALVSLRQIIRELEQTQETVWSPMVLNGSGFGMMANHSLVMASYISRANAAIIDLNKLLTQG
ncbi:DUF2333 family protein [Psychrobium sp. 1_MG-2023]|uniref:DUF2333 family protein n=1 Tax=Psychrobium sp. 1_MG-2023 TaxID=3062624 RepID=UPI00351EB749